MNKLSITAEVRLLCVEIYCSVQSITVLPAHNSPGDYV
jgi:hypothetical protein